jgi:hypothetical protein
MNRQIFQCFDVTAHHRQLLKTAASGRTAHHRNVGIELS